MSRKPPPPKRPNSERRSREYLTHDEVERLCEAVRRQGRHGVRNAAMLLLTYRHALRVSELIALRWEQVDFKDAGLFIKRKKNGLDSTHPLYGPELRVLRQLRRSYPDTPYISERKSPMTAANVRKVVARAGEGAKLGFPVHPHMLRHACGYKLANDGHDTRAIQHYLGHKNIQHTVCYTELSPKRFEGFWQD